MRLSTKGRYAVMAMVDLAVNGVGKPIALAEISVRQQISLSYLEQLFARLRQSGLVKSARGPGGGYFLSKPIDGLYVSEIIMAVDEPIKATRCVQTPNKLGANKRQSKESAALEKGCMPGGERCLTHNLWEDLGHAIHDYLSRVTLKDVIDKSNHRRVSVDISQDLKEVYPA